MNQSDEQSKECILYNVVKELVKQKYIAVINVILLLAV
jgi:hypothetical protein